MGFVCGIRFPKYRNSKHAAPAVGQPAATIHAEPASPVHSAIHSRSTEMTMPAQVASV